MCLCRQGKQQPRRTRRTRTTGRQIFLAGKNHSHHGNTLVIVFLSFSTSLLFLWLSSPVGSENSGLQMPITAEQFATTMENMSRAWEAKTGSWQSWANGVWWNFKFAVAGTSGRTQAAKGRREVFLWWLPANVRPQMKLLHDSETLSLVRMSLIWFDFIVQFLQATNYCCQRSHEMSRDLFTSFREVWRDDCPVAFWRVLTSWKGTLGCRVPLRFEV